MSLINQMLRDLEQRRDDDADPRRVRAVADSERRSGALIWLGLAAFLLPILLGLAWLYLPFPVSFTDSTPSSNAVLDTRPTLGNGPGNGVGNVNGIDLTTTLDEDQAGRGDGPMAGATVTLLAVEQVETRDGHRLRLDFDGDSAYRRRAGGEHRLVLEVQAVVGPEVTDSLPPGVSELRASKLDDPVRRFEFILTEGWEAGPLYLETAPGGGDRLSLSLRRPEAAVAQSDDVGTSAPDTSGPGTSDPGTSDPVRSDSDTPRAGSSDSVASTAPVSDTIAEASGESADVVAFDDDAVEAEQDMRRERRTRSDEDRAAEAWTEAREALQRGRLGSAETALERVLLLHPAHVPAREALADLLADTGRVAEADQVLAASLDIERLPASELGYFARQRARLWLDQDETQRGIEALEAVYPERDAAPESGALLAGLYYRQGDYPRAVDHYRRLTEQRPEQGAWWMGMGLALEGMGEYDSAVDAYRRALAGDGLGPSVRDYLQTRVRELTD